MEWVEQGVAAPPALSADDWGNVARVWRRVGDLPVAWSAALVAPLMGALVDLVEGAGGFILLTTKPRRHRAPDSRGTGGTRLMRAPQLTTLPWTSLEG